jgi:hypothetical protein
VPGCLSFFTSLSASPDSWSSSEAARFNDGFEAMIVQDLDVILFIYTDDEYRRMEFGR